MARSWECTSEKRMIRNQTTTIIYKTAKGFIQDIRSQIPERSPAMILTESIIDAATLIAESRRLPIDYEILACYGTTG
jgi:hypothetical protein